MIVVCCEDLLCLIICYHWLLKKDLKLWHKISSYNEKDWLDFIANTYQEYKCVRATILMYID